MGLSIFVPLQKKQSEKDLEWESLLPEEGFTNGNYVTYYDGDLL